MITFMRRLASTWVAKALFVLLVLSFAVWGIEDVVRKIGRDTAVATVGGNSNVANGGGGDGGDGDGDGDGNGNSDSNSGRRRRRRHNGCSDNLTDHFTRGEGIIK